MHFKILLPAFLGLAFTFTLPAVADQYTFTLDHCSGGCGSAPFGNVDVTQDGTNTVKIVASLSSGDEFIRTGFPGSFAFDVFGDPKITVSDLTTGWSLLNRNAGNHHFDGFGNLDYVLLCDICGHGGSKPFAGSITFDVTAAGLTTADFMDLSRIPPGTESAYFVADILGTSAFRRG
jgi:hypothetical protein